MDDIIVFDGMPLWLQNLKELKKSSGLTSKQIADKYPQYLTERTVHRIFSGETEHPRIDTLYLIIKALGCTLNDVFADTNVVVATEKLVEIKEVAEVVEAEKNILTAENAILKDKVAALTAENDLLKMKLLHKEELLAVHNYYTKLKIE